MKVLPFSLGIALLAFIAGWGTSALLDGPADERQSSGAGKPEQREVPERERAVASVAVLSSKDAENTADSSPMTGHPAASWSDLGALYDALSAMDSAGLARFATSLYGEDGEIDTDSKAFDLLVARWSEVDRSAALEFARAKGQPGQGDPLLFALIRNWTVEAPAAAWDYAMSENLRNQSLSRRLRNVVIAEVSERDPFAALGLMEEHLSLTGSNELHLYQNLFFELAKRDPTAARARLEMLDGPAAHRANYGMANYYGMYDPVAGLGFLESVSGNQRRSLANILMQKWIEREPRLAADTVLTLDESELRETLIADAMQIWFRYDENAALAWAGAYRSDPGVEKAWTHALRSLAWSDPQKAIRLTEAMPELADEKVSIVQSWIQHEPDAAIAWAEQNLSETEMVEALNHSIYGLAHQNPEKAAALIDLMPIGPQREHALQQVARNFAQQDVQGALKWLETQSDDRAKHQALVSVISDWAETEPSEALAYALATHGENKVLSDELIARIAGAWASTDPAAAIAWVDQLEPGKVQDEARNSAISQWARTEPELADAYVRSLPEGSVRRDAVRRYVASLVRTDPAEAVEWYQNLDASDRDDTLTRNLVAGWTNADAYAASEWIAALPEGHERDVAATELVGQLYHRAPNDALPWALSIGDEKLRNQALNNVASGASSMDAKLTAQAIDATTFDDNKKAALRRRYLK